MSPAESRLYRLSPSQLRALFLLAKSEDGIIVSTATSKELGKEGKAWGGFLFIVPSDHPGRVSCASMGKK